jgi:hypothetical protein
MSSRTCHSCLSLFFSPYFFYTKLFDFFLDMFRCNYEVLNFQSPPNSKKKLYRVTMTEGLSAQAATLINAVIANDLRKVRSSIKNGTDINIRDSQGNSLLHLAIKRQNIGGTSHS